MDNVPQTLLTPQATQRDVQFTMEISTLFGLKLTQMEILLQQCCQEHVTNLLVMEDIQALTTVFLVESTTEITLVNVPTLLALFLLARTLFANLSDKIPLGEMEET